MAGYYWFYRIAVTPIISILHPNFPVCRNGYGQIRMTPSLKNEGVLRDRQWACQAKFASANMRFACGLSCQLVHPWHEDQMSARQNDDRAAEVQLGHLFKLPITKVGQEITLNIADITFVWLVLGWLVWGSACATGMT